MSVAPQCNLGTALHKLDGSVGYSFAHVALITVVSGVALHNPNCEPSSACLINALVRDLAEMVAGGLVHFGCTLPRKNCKLVQYFSKFSPPAPINSGRRRRWPGTMGRSEIEHYLGSLSVQSAGRGLGGLC